VIGAGLITQVEHLPNLLALPELYEVVGVVDASAQLRMAIRARHGVAVFADESEMMSARPEAVLIALPDALHGVSVRCALERGLHVLCEKPLCLTVSEAVDIARRRDAADVVVQVGYMKRFDPAYEASLAELPRGGEGLRYITVEVTDADAAPFVAHRGLVKGSDVSEDAAHELKMQTRDLCRESMGNDCRDEDVLNGYGSVLMSGLIHQVNVVHGMLEYMGLSTEEHVMSGRIFARGQGAAATVALAEGEVLWHMAQVMVPQLPVYREHYKLLFDSKLVELTFPSPYLNHHQATLDVTTGSGSSAEMRRITSGYSEAFVRELEGFWWSVIDGTPVRNAVEDAIRDIATIQAIGALLGGRD